MKINNYLLVSALIVLGLLISGCQQGNPNNPEGDTDNNSSGQAANLEVDGEGDGDSGPLNVDPNNLENDDLLKLQDRLNVIVDSDDLERCKELPVDQYYISCETYMLSNRAENAEDTAVCYYASTEFIKGRCVALVERK